MNTLAITLTPAAKWLLVSATCFVMIAVLASCYSPKRGLPVARPHVSRDLATRMWSWGFIARNGVEVHASNRQHADKGEAIAHYSTVRRRMTESAAPDLIVRMKDDEGKFRWKILETNGTLECSNQGFATANACRENYSDLRTAVIACPPQDLDVIPQPIK